MSSPSPLEFRFPGGSPFRTKREREDALALIRRLVIAPGIAAGASVVTVEALIGGRSAARVFKVTPLFGAGLRPAKATPVVVKIAPRAQGLREKANYDRYVRSGLPAACRAELLGFAATRAQAGLCYAFVGGRDGAGLETLTDHLQRGETATLDLVLRRIFTPLRRTWYAPEMIRAHRDIARYYRERFFAGARGAAQDEAILRAVAARAFGARRRDGGYAIGAAWFPSPYTVLFAGGAKRPYHSCILHGDLNTDNILVGRGRARSGVSSEVSSVDAGEAPGDVPDRGPGGVADRRPGRARVTLIDFQKTGRGHVYQDLAFLEASLRINFPPDAAFDAIVETERLIALGRRPPRATRSAQTPTAETPYAETPHAETPYVETPYAAAIRRIRDFAFRGFGAVEDKATYHFAIAALGLRLMQATDLSDIARARIAISALWAAKALAEEDAD